jgi:sugar lactone lactonase YvrE
MISLFRSSHLAALACLSAAFLGASDTRTWSQSDYGDFQKGLARNLSLRSDGLVTLAPRLHELYDSSLPYLWAVAQDSKGNVYAGGGTDAKLFRIPPDGKGKLLAEFETLAVEAVAVDSKDRVYAATSPDGKVYRITGNSKPEIFFDPKAKYIWALAFDKNGDLYVATGDQGEIYRVTPDGKGKTFFKTDETHVRSMAFDANGNLVVGTDPGGLVLRISPAGEGFVLYQMSKREVTAVAVARDGSIYASAVGNKQGQAAPASAPVALAPSAPTSVTAPNAPAPAARAAAPPPASSGGSSVSGGSEVYRIEPNGNPERIWNSAQDVVYAIAFDAQGRAILGAGNRGNAYRIESPARYTSLVTVAATQITGFLTGPDGKLLAVTGNVGKVYEIGPDLEREGTLQSDVFDAGMYSQWGRVSFETNLSGGKIAITTRSGNLDQPQKNWSPWSAPVLDPKGSRSGSPAARFVQWKATLTAASDGHSPELESVDLAFLPKNVAPRLELVEITPSNYKFPAPSASAAGPPRPGAEPLTLSLPALGSSTAAKSSAPADSSTSTPSMQWGKGFMGARWLARDPNGDSMVYTVEIRGVKETGWKMLKSKVAEKYLSWDSSAFPDGEYRLRVTASDAPGNPPSEALTARIESEPFLIDNTPPRISGLTAARNNGKIEIRWHAADALNNVSLAEYSLDGGDWTVAAPTTQLSDSPELDYTLTLDAGPGEHTNAVRVTDDYDNQTTDKAVVQ